MDSSEPVLDVREIDEPPFDTITDALDDLEEGSTLTLVNSFEPAPLYNVLESRGFVFDPEQVDDEEWRIKIEHA